LSTTEIVASWTIVIIRNGVYSRTITFTDQDGNPETLTSAEIVVTPNGAAEFSWTQGNGKLVNTGPGAYFLTLDEIDTASYLWPAGHYRIEIVDLSGNVTPCITEGLVFARDC